MNQLLTPELIRKRRIEAGISQVALAKRAGRSMDILVRLETGRHTNPTLNTLTAFTEALIALEKEKGNPPSQVA